MRDTVWEGKEQKMTLEDGRQKGMKQVLIERDVDVKGMNAEQMREELKKFDDFNDCLTILEEDKDICVHSSHASTVS